MSKVIYVAAPLGGLEAHCDAESQHRNVLVACYVGERIVQNGGVPIVPHLFWYWATLQNPDLDRKDWVRIDLEYVRRCDGLVRVAGGSKGADTEVELAESLGIPVFHLTDHNDFSGELWDFIQGGK